MRWLFAGLLGLFFHSALFCVGDVRAQDVGPVVDISGVWHAHVPANPSFDPSRPPIDYYLTLRAIDVAVASNGADIVIQYEGTFVVDSFLITFVGGGLPSQVTPCSASYTVRTGGLGSRVISYPVHGSSNVGYNVLLLADGDPDQPQAGANITIRDPSGTFSDTPLPDVMKGRDLYVGLNYGPSAGPLSTVMCDGAKHGSQNQTTFRHFERVSAVPGDLDVRGAIGGAVVSSTPTITETDNEVHFATVSLYRQDRFVRGQRVDETDEDYEAYIAERIAGRTLLAQVKIAPDDQGEYVLGAPSLFRFKDIPVLELSGDGGVRSFHPARYWIVVEDAETEEMVLDDFGAPIPGRSQTLVFSDGSFANVTPPVESVQVPVDPLLGLGVKESITDVLRMVCPNNFATVENEVIDYLDQIALGQIELDEIVNEGLRRAIWAERASRLGVNYAEELFEIALTGLGTVLADVFDDKTDATSTRLRDATARRERIEATSSSIPQELLDGFNLDPEDVSTGSAAAIAEQMDVLFDNAALADRLKKIMKGALPLAQMELEALGVDAGVAEAVVGHTGTVLNFALSFIQADSVAGASKGLIKQGISAVVEASAPLWLDAPVPGSYCSFHAEFLEVSRDRMLAWSVADQDAYLIDRAGTVDALLELNEKAGETVVDSFNLLTAGEYLDTAQDLVGLIDRFPIAAAIEKILLATKYFANLSSVVRPIWFLYATNPDLIEAATYAAYGLEPPVSSSTRAVQSIRAQTAHQGIVGSAPSTAELIAALDELRALVEADEIGQAISHIADEGSGGFARERREFDAAAAAITTQLTGFVPNGSETYPLTVIDGTVGEVELLADALDFMSRLEVLIGDVLGNQYADNNDPAYRSGRDRVIAALDDYARSVEDFSALLATLVSGAASRSFVPAVTATINTIASESIGGPTITQSPDSFTVRARVHNLGNTAVDNVSARLTVSSPKGSTVVLSPAERIIGSLSANDGATSNDDSATRQWTVGYDGDLTSETILLQVEVLESGEDPTGFVTGTASAELAVDQALADADLDSLPDDYEVANGLDPQLDDALADLDDDGVVNLAERRLGTKPDDPDTDGDGLDDGEEISGGVDGYRTDPLRADTDDDGVDDNADGAPTDGATSAFVPPPPEPVVSVSTTRVVLSPDAPFAAVDVSNAGGGTLSWSASTENDAIAVATPGFPDVSGSETLLITIAPSYDFTIAGANHTTIKLSDAGGADGDTVTIFVGVGAVNTDSCGEAVDDSGLRAPGDGVVTASDALGALRAAVGLDTCEPCICDVDFSGAVTATDALAILGAAVGQDIELACPACG